MTNANDAVNPTPTIEDLPDSQVAGDKAGQSYEQAGASSVSLEDILASPELEAYVDKVVKQKQDVRLGKYGTRLDVAEEAIAKYDVLVDGGMSKSDAKAKIKYDKELDDKMTKLDAMLGGNISEPSAGAGEIDWGGKQATILDNAGISKDDPRIVELLRTSKSKQDFVVALEEQTFVWKQADAKKPQPSSSTVAQIIPSVVAEKGALDAYNDEQLGDKLVELAKEPSKNREQMDLLDKELRTRDAKKG